LHTKLAGGLSTNLSQSGTALLEIVNVIATFKNGEISLAKYQTVLLVSIVYSTSGGRKKELKQELLGNRIIRI